MSCEKYASLLQDYIDRELDSQSVKHVIEHCRVCCRCKESLEQIRCLKELLKTKYQCPSAPVGLTQQIRYRILQARSPSLQKSKKMKMGFVVGVILTILCLCGVFFKTKVTDVNLQLIQDHQRVQAAHRLPVDPVWQIGTNDPHQLEAWFQTQSQKKVFIPRFENTQIKLECGGSAQFLGETVLLACYKYNASNMTLFIMAKDSFVRHSQEEWFQEYQKGPCKVASCQGYQVLYWQREDFVYALVVEPYFLAQFKEIQDWVNRELL